MFRRAGKRDHKKLDVNARSPGVSVRGAPLTTELPHDITPEKPAHPDDYATRQVRKAEEWVIHGNNRKPLQRLKARLQEFKHEAIDEARQIGPAEGVLLLFAAGTAVTSLHASIAGHIVAETDMKAALENPTAIVATCLKGDLLDRPIAVDAEFYQVRNAEECKQGDTILGTATVPKTPAEYTADEKAFPSMNVVEQELYILTHMPDAVRSWHEPGLLAVVAVLASIILHVRRNHTRRDLIDNGLDGIDDDALRHLMEKLFNNPEDFNVNSYDASLDRMLARAAREPLIDVNQDAVTGFKEAIEKPEFRADVKRCIDALTAWKADKSPENSQEVLDAHENVIKHVAEATQGQPLFVPAGANV